ncbi:MAG: pirin family protein, partial [Bacteroidota bacterium]
MRHGCIQKNGLMWGFQLWANLSASHKMMDPRYQDIRSDQIPEIALDTGAKVRIICGKVNSLKGPVQDIVIDPEYLDIAVPSKSNFTHTVKRGHTVFAYVIEGEGYFDQGRDSYVSEVEGADSSDLKGDGLIGSENLIIFHDGDEVAIS